MLHHYDNVVEISTCAVQVSVAGQGYHYAVFSGAGPIAQVSRVTGDNTVLWVITTEPGVDTGTDFSLLVACP